LEQTLCAFDRHLHAAAFFAQAGISAKAPRCRGLHSDNRLEFTAIAHGYFNPHDETQTSQTVGAYGYA
jgi:hypothetical protein